MDDYINTVLIQELSKFNDLRKELYTKGLKNKIVFGILLTIGLIIGYYYTLYEAETEFEADTAFLIIGSLVIFIFTTTKPTNFIGKDHSDDFYSRFKFNVVRKSINNIDPNLVYKPIFKTHKKQLVQSKLFETFTDYKEDDGIIGEYQEYCIQISEIHLLNGLKKVFDGLFVKLVFNKAIGQDKLYNAVYELEKECGVELKSSIGNDRLYLAINHPEKLFETSLIKENDAQVVENVVLIYKINTFVKSLY